MSKNIALLSSIKNGYTFYKLACTDKLLCDFFDDWSYQLSTTKSHNTVKSYSHAVASFIDYILEVELIHDGLTPQLIKAAISSYESFKVFGKDSNSLIASSAAIKLNPRPLSSSSIQIHFAAINDFIEANENFRESLLDLEESGFIDSNIASNIPLFDAGRSGANFRIRENIKKSSWFSGCLAGGVKKIKNKALSPKSRASSVIYSSDGGGDQKTFPFDKAASLISSAPNARDRCLWGLIAATGCRVSEALSVLINDIDLKSRKIYIIPPSERLSLLSKYIGESELEKISHKGRTTSQTYLIQPFITMFWAALNEYINSTYKRGASHRFLFQKRDGLPFVNSYRAALEQFQNTSENVTGKRYGFHSLRHMYGYYLKNWAPNADGKFGFPLSDVQAFMGHKDINTTRRYARDDAIKLDAMIRYANALQSQGQFTSISEQKVKTLEQEIKRLKSLTDGAPNYSLDKKH